jgi:hypothetical protein
MRFLMLVSVPLVVKALQLQTIPLTEVELTS